MLRLDDGGKAGGAPWAECLTGLLLRAESSPPNVRMVKSQAPLPQNATIFGDRVSKEVIK